MRILYYALCTAGMMGAFFATKYLVTGFSRDFGIGVAVGAIIAAALGVIVTRIEAVEKRRKEVDYLP